MARKATKKEVAPVEPVVQEPVSGRKRRAEVPAEQGMRAICRCKASILKARADVATPTE